MSDTKEKTTVQEVDINLADILGSGVDNIMVPGEKPPKKPTVFTSMTTDTSFLDKPIKAEDEPADPADPPVDPLADPAAPPADPPADPPVDPVDDGIDPLAPPTDDDFLEDEDEKNKGGRPTVAVGALKSLFDNKVLLPFEDDKKLEDYTQADIEELIKANLAQQKADLQQELPNQFFGSMPTEMQQAYQYIANGGQDLKGLFQAMSSSQEIRQVNVEDEPGQVYAVRSYLQATQYGTPDEIEDEIRSLQDRGDLEKKAKQFKPKLDAMSQNMVNQKLAQQEQETVKRQQQSQNYMDNVYTVLEGGELSGIKLDNRVQNMLYAGLVQPNYPSANGKQTNQLGHLLEKYQWIEPRHDLIAEALWLLADPDGYRGEIRKQGSTAQVEDTVRKLKTEQQLSKTGGSVQDDPEDNGQRQRQSGVKRPTKNFFARK